MFTLLDLLAADEVEIERQNLLRYIENLFLQIELRDLRCEAIQISPAIYDLFKRVLPEAVPDALAVHGTPIVGEWWGAKIYLDPKHDNLTVLSAPEFCTKAETVFNVKG